MKRQLPKRIQTRPPLQLQQAWRQDGQQRPSDKKNPPTPKAA